MDIKKQVKAFGLIESLVNDGHTMSTLPISSERAGAIISMQEAATEQDIAMLIQVRARATTDRGRNLGR